MRVCFFKSNPLKKILFFTLKNTIEPCKKYFLNKKIELDYR